ncbi:putative quinol monooxygenase [Undibacterium terreum]|uniref:Antibiotic biosynthesis monooxygenase n=1 Tax=Undibacterium terreum TaxID=1224302 RepID=A0A916UCP5_9BURK|nr:putative quinol monooxygenase [Undibacterium terreum]GGC68794.1 antibiotic biosynthesis monooxygenase [Undibacterium terreum]
MPITKIMFVRAKSGYEETLGSLLLTLVQPSRLESACLGYDLHRATEDPALWFIYQNWNSEEAFNAYMKKAVVRACLRDARHMVEASMNLHPFKMVSQPASSYIDNDHALAA